MNFLLDANASVAVARWLIDRGHNVENLPRSQRKALVHDVLDRHSKDLESGAIVIALNRKFRVRRQP